jgi:type VI protein secretion system component VasK
VGEIGLKIQPEKIGKSAPRARVMRGVLLALFLFYGVLLAGLIVELVTSPRIIQWRIIVGANLLLAMMTGLAWLLYQMTRSDHSKHEFTSLEAKLRQARKKGHL